MAEVAITIASLDTDAGPLREYWSLLDEPERARATGFRFKRHRRRFIVRRAKLRLILGAATGRSPAGLAFTANEHGKPALAGGPYFSLSHSGERMMLALAEVPVGCDIERIDPTLDWQPLSASLFAPAEHRALEVAHPPAFFDCWARKEAFVKAIGLGLSYPLDAFTVSVGFDAKLLSGGKGWAIAAAPVGQDYAGAIVARADGTPLTLAPSVMPFARTTGAGAPARVHETAGAPRSPSASRQAS